MTTANGAVAPTPDLLKAIEEAIHPALEKQYQRGLDEADGNYDAGYRAGFLEGVQRGRKRALEEFREALDRVQGVAAHPSSLEVVKRDPIDAWIDELQEALPERVKSGTMILTRATHLALLEGFATLLQRKADGDVEGGAPITTAEVAHQAGFSSGTAGVALSWAISNGWVRVLGKTEDRKRILAVSTPKN